MTGGAEASGERLRIGSRHLVLAFATARRVPGEAVGFSLNAC
jgi:hypothetical protein